MTGFEIGALIAAIAGAAMQYKASDDARRRQQRIIQDNLSRQRELQMQGEAAALDRAKDFAPDERNERQQQLEQDATDQLINPVQQAQPAMQDQSAVQGQVSSDYTAARAKSQASELRSANELARILGKVTGAQRLRTNEALAMAETGQLIDRLSRAAQGGYSAAQADASLAGQPNGGMVLAGSLMQTGGALAAGGAFRGAGAARQGGNAWTGFGNVANNGEGLLNASGAFPR